MEFLTEYGLFLAKVVTFVVAAIILASVIVSATQRDRSDHEGEGELKIRKLNDQYRKLKESIQSRLMSDAEHKAWQKQKKKEEKAEKKSAKQDKTAEDEKTSKPRIYVIDFDGDIKASDTDTLMDGNNVDTLALKPPENPFRSLMNNIRDDLRTAIQNRGIEIIDVRLKRVELPTEITQGVFRQMIETRNQEATDQRTQGDRDAAEIRAQADRLRIEKEAAANRRSEQIRGEGDAERNRIYAEAYEQDAELKKQHEDQFMDDWKA